VRRAALAVALALGACSREPAPPQRRALGPLVQGAIARLEAELGAAATAESSGATGPANPDLPEQVAGLLSTLVTSRDALRKAALADFERLGDAAVPELARRLTEQGLQPEEVSASVEALAAVDTRAAADALLARLELMRKQVDPEAWIRAQCAWRLGQMEQDWTLPRLLVCLRYEKDYDTVVWIADGLAGHGNLAGLGALDLIVTDDTFAEARAQATEELAKLAQERDCADVAELWRIWNGEDPQGKLKPREPTPALRLEIWRVIRSLAEFQLRGVDDARFVLSNMNAWVVAELAEALGDESRYVRVHCAQALERMGPQAAAAGPRLVEALADPELAADAAAALGSIGYAPGRPALVELLAQRVPLELRVAAARSLGQIAARRAPDLECAQTLEPLFAAREPLELRAAAAEGLVRAAPLERTGAAAQFLLEQMASTAIDPTGPERALDDWIARRAEDRSAAALELQAKWRELGKLQAAAGEPQREKERLAQRAALLRGALPKL
jgi:HEAT repeat protein